MTRRRWLLAAAVALPLLGAGLAYARTLARESGPSKAGAGYVCPLTGEELPCPNCCPLKGQ